MEIANKKTNDAENMDIIDKVFYMLKDFMYEEEGIELKDINQIDREKFIGTLCAMLRLLAKRERKDD